MKPKRKKALLIALGALATLGTGSFFLLRHLVDPESFRAPLRSRLEAHLGRPVDFGAVDVSLWPVGLRLNDLVIGRTPDERFDDPVRADRLRVGTRLVPLIRGRLEITSVIVDAPVVLAYQRADGSWEPSFGADEAQDGVSRGDGSRSALVVEHLRVRRGRIVVRSERPDRLPEAKLTDVDLSLDDLGRGGRVPFKLSADSGSDGKLTARGSASPQGFESRVEIEDLTTQTLREWLSVLAPSIEPAADLLADRPFSAGARLEYTASSPVTLDIADAFVRGPALRLSRSLDGDWNLSSVVERIRSGAS